MLAIFEYIEAWYKRKRIHSSIGYLMPQKCEDLAREIAYLAISLNIQKLFYCINNSIWPSFIYTMITIINSDNFTVA